jgi:hypothetical protein
MSVEDKRYAVVPSNVSAESNVKAAIRRNPLSLFQIGFDTKPVNLPLSIFSVLRS